MFSAHAVKDHDRVVDRIAGDGEQSGERGQAEIEPQQHEQAEGRDHVVQECDQGADAELPFEAEPHIDRDGGQGGEHGDHTAMHQLRADLGTDRFGAAQLVFVADRILDQLDRHLLAPFGALVGRHVDARGVGVAARQLTLLGSEADPAHRVAPVRRVERAGCRELDVAGIGRAGLDAPAVAGAALHDALGIGHALGVALLALHADQGRAGVAEFLQRHLSHAQRTQRGAQLVEMDRALLGAHLDGDAAFEVDAEIEAEHQGAQQRQDVDRRRNRERDLALSPGSRTWCERG